MGEHQILAAILAVVVEGLEGINVNHGMTDKMIKIFSEDFLEVFYTDSLEDLILFFKYLRRGELGTIYNRLDVPTLFDAYRKYLDIKWAEKEKGIHGNKESIYDRAALIASLVGDKFKLTEDQENRLSLMEQELESMDLTQLGLMLRYEVDQEMIKKIQEKIFAIIKK